MWRRGTEGISHKRISWRRNQASGLGVFCPGGNETPSQDGSFRYVTHTSQKRPSFESGFGVSNRVASSVDFPYLEGMEVRFSPDVETRLQQVALANGKDAEQLVKDTVARMLENQASFMAGVENGIAQADRGEVIDHKDVVTRINRLFET